MAVDKTIPQGIANFEELTLRANIALNNTGHYDPIYSMPTKEQVGHVYYFGASIVDTDITSEGLWMLQSTGWTKIG